MSPKRHCALNTHSYRSEPILYWMQREHRVADNWALLYAQELAQKHKTYVVVAVCFRRRFRHATERLMSFIYEGLQEVEQELRNLQIPFFFMLGKPVQELQAFIKSSQIGTVVTEFHPLRTERRWRSRLAACIDVPFYEVDARNIVPCWVASPKQEYAAYTFRPKIQRLLPLYLTSFPPVKPQKYTLPPPSDWRRVQREIAVDTTVPKLRWIRGGMRAARSILDTFLERRLASYDLHRNNPTKPGQSDLSPHLHFGHISAQRVALEVSEQRVPGSSKHAFLEELIVRRELADNFCFYNPQYDNISGAPDWTRQTLKKHLADRRDFLYDLEELEQAKTHDYLWNSAQTEAIYRGKMHGYIRMYWAKKILEWSRTPQEAMKRAIYLMDKYFIDGRDPNGFTGIAWSILGVHDRAWAERPIFGKIRYMNLEGAKSKFDVEAYIGGIVTYNSV